MNTEIRPAYLLQKNPYRDFKYNNIYVDNQFPQAINLKIDSIDKPIQYDLFGFKRDIGSEVLLPKSVFVSFGVAQPAWFLIEEKDQSNPNEEEQEFTSISKHVCLAFIGEQEEYAMLPPRLWHAF